MIKNIVAALAINLSLSFSLSSLSLSLSLSLGWSKVYIANNNACVINNSQTFRILLLKVNKS